jgi:hypothetical protein
MVATHVASMNVLRRMKGSETIPQQDSNGSLAVKLLRTFVAQIEALQRHRGKGEQKVTVEHVHVHAGGQARGESGVDLAFGTSLHDVELHPLRLRRFLRVSNDALGI